VRRLWQWLRSELGVGWTFDSGTLPIGVWDNADKELPFVKALEPTIPAGQAGWLFTFVRTIIRAFVVLAKNFGNVANIRVQANNSTGDVQGVGPLVITIITT